MDVESTPKELFISYGREPEVLAFVCRLKGDLERNGFTVWLDLHVRTVTTRACFTSHFSHCRTSPQAVTGMVL